MKNAFKTYESQTFGYVWNTFSTFYISIVTFADILNKYYGCVSLNLLNKMSTS